MNVYKFKSAKENSSQIYILSEMNKLIYVISRYKFCNIFLAGL